MRKIFNSVLAVKNNVHTHTHARVFVWQTQRTQRLSDYVRVCLYLREVASVLSPYSLALCWLAKQQVTSAHGALLSTAASASAAELYSYLCALCLNFNELALCVCVRLNC